MQELVLTTLYPNYQRNRIHCRSSFVPWPAVYINYAEFQEGIALREALRTMRNSPASYKQAVPFREIYGHSHATR